MPSGFFLFFRGNGPEGGVANTNRTMNEEKVLALLKAQGVPMKSGEVADAIGLPKADVDKAIKNLVKEGKAESPKRCYYTAVKK